MSSKSICILIHMHNHIRYTERSRVEVGGCMLDTKAEVLFDRCPLNRIYNSVYMHLCVYLFSIYSLVMSNWMMSLKTPYNSTLDIRCYNVVIHNLKRECFCCFVGLTSMCVFVWVCACEHIELQNACIRSNHFRFHSLSHTHTLTLTLSSFFNSLEGKRTPFHSFLCTSLGRSLFLFIHQRRDRKASYRCHVFGVMVWLRLEIGQSTRQIESRRSRRANCICGNVLPHCAINSTLLKRKCSESHHLN